MHASSYLAAVMQFNQNSANLLSFSLIFWQSSPSNFSLPSSSCSKLLMRTFFVSISERNFSISLRKRLQFYESMCHLFHEFLFMHTNADLNKMFAIFDIAQDREKGRVTLKYQLKRYVNKQHGIQGALAVMRDKCSERKK